MSVQVLPHSRPASLYQPDIAGSSASVLNHSSYSPFPSFGVKHDPHGLDKFLLPPYDSAWLYSQAPPAEDSSSNPATQPSQPPSQQPSKIKKNRSFSSLRRPSPLSQPPVNSDSTSALGRRRSNSESLSLPAEEDMVPLAEVSESPKVTKRQTIRRVLSFRNKSVFGMSATLSEQNGSKAAVSTTSLVSVTDDQDAMPRLCRRSNSTYSEASISSTASSDEVITPNTDVPQEDLTGAKLTAALESEVGQSRRRTILGWFGGKRKSPSPEDNGLLSPADEPIVSSRVFPSLTPNGVEDDLVASAISSAERFINRGYLIEQLRRMSYGKLNALNQTSTHPWARTLGRQDQNQNLFDEIAPTLHPDIRSFPFSVNAPDESAALYSMQRREFAKICVRQVIAKLDHGMVPEVPLTNTCRLPCSMPKRRLPYPSDFLTRPPYEERNLVFFPNGTFSPISMARPGYGVWDIDYSRYISVLCSIDQNPATATPRPEHTEHAEPQSERGRRLSSFSAVEPSLGDVSLVSDSSSTPDSEPDDMLVSPAPVIIPLEDVDVATEEPAVVGEEEPVSSFRRRVAAIWESSSGEEDEDAEDQVETLVAALKRSQVTPTMMNPLPRLVGIKSAPKIQSAEAAAKRVSTVDIESSRHKFAEQLARNRERRSANDHGEGERRVEIEKRRAAFASPSPPPPPPPPPRRSASSVPPTVPRDRRGRTMSAQDLTELSVPRPLAVRQHSLPASPSHQRRSLYDAPSSASPCPPDFQPVFAQQSTTFSHPAFAPSSHHAQNHHHAFTPNAYNHHTNNNNNNAWTMHSPPPSTYSPPSRRGLPSRSPSYFFSLGAPVSTPQPALQHTKRHIA